MSNQHNNFYLSSSSQSSLLPSTNAVTRGVTLQTRLLEHYNHNLEQKSQSHVRNDSGSSIESLSEESVSFDNFDNFFSNQNNSLDSQNSNFFDPQNHTSYSHMSSLSSLLSDPSDSKNNSDPSKEKILLIVPHL